MTTYAILDFETTGMSLDYGACPTEIAIVLEGYSCLLTCLAR
jgi:DNA polymerase-3 subunit epsilon